MQLEELTKTQIVLLTLLVSFVTSIATGIITVTLMDQAPPGITQTVNRVVERTVEVIVPEKSQNAAVDKTIIVREEDFIIDATKTNKPNLVALSIENSEGENISLGIGFVVTKDGIIATDKSLFSLNEEGDVVENNILATTNSKVEYQTDVLSVPHERLAFLRVIPSKNEEGEVEENPSFFAPTFAEDDTLELGQTAVALGFDKSPTVLVGVISELQEISSTGTTTPQSSSLHTISTTLEKQSDYFGAPLLNTNTDLVGIAVSGGEDTLIAVPASSIKKALGEYKKEEEKRAKEESDA